MKKHKGQGDDVGGDGRERERGGRGVGGGRQSERKRPVSV